MRRAARLGGTRSCRSCVHTCTTRGGQASWTAPPPNHGLVQTLSTKPLETPSPRPNHPQPPPTAPSFGHKLPDKLKRLVEQCWAASYEERPEMIQVISTLEEVLRELPPDPPSGGGCACTVQ